MDAEAQLEAYLGRAAAGAALPVADRACGARPDRERASRHSIRRRDAAQSGLHPLGTEVLERNLGVATARGRRLGATDTSRDAELSAAPGPAGRRHRRATDRERLDRCRREFHRRADDRHVRGSTVIDSLRGAAGLSSVTPPIWTRTPPDASLTGVSRRAAGPQAGPQGSRPSCRARATISARELTPSFMKMRRKCVATVHRLISESRRDRLVRQPPGDQPARFPARADSASPGAVVAGCPAGGGG